MRRPADKPSELGETSEEAKIYDRLGKAIGHTGDFDHLMKNADHFAQKYQEALRHGNDYLLKALATAQGIYLSIRDNRSELKIFLRHPYWKGKPPTTNKLMLACVKLTTRPADEAQRKLASKHAAAVEFFCMLGVLPSELPSAVREFDGGLTRAASERAKTRQFAQEASTSGTASKARSTRTIERDKGERAQAAKMHTSTIRTEKNDEIVPVSKGQLFAKAEQAKGISQLMQDHLGRRLKLIVEVTGKGLTVIKASKLVKSSSGGVLHGL